MNEEIYMKKACDLSELSVLRSGGPFGCVIVNKTTGEIVGKGHNMVTISRNPTLHAEIVAIGDACHYMNTIDLSCCDLYTSCEPCPMCLSAIYWAHIDTIFYANTQKDAADIGFDDSFIYDEINKPMNERKVKMIRMENTTAPVAFQEWNEKKDKMPY